jgi:hypothetical protein
MRTFKYLMFARVILGLLKLSWEGWCMIWHEINSYELCSYRRQAKILVPFLIIVST